MAFSLQSNPPEMCTCTRSPAAVLDQSHLNEEKGNAFSCRANVGLTRPCDDTLIQTDYF